MTLLPDKDESIIAFAALRDTLLTITEVTDIVGQEIHKEDVEDDLALPYIVAFHITGGYENKTQAHAVDTYWKVVGYTANKQTANDLLSAIGKLHYMDLDNTNEPNLDPYGGIQREIPIWERDNEQDVPVYGVGGIFRLRFIVNPTV